MMIDVGAAQVGRHLGFPTHGYLALSDAKVPDYQAGLETGIGAVVGALAGINLISGPGILDYILTQSLEKLLLDHEACGLALRLLRGIERREGDSLTLIAELVKAGSFLAHAHTRKHWRQELSLPGPLVDRATYGDWEKAGALWAHERAATEVEKRVREARVPPLPEATASALTSIMRAEAARFGMAKLPPLE
jgi:trimethylamine--corrinoid protein Co-methyltransferase